MLATAGCGSGEYNRRLEQRLSTVAADNALAGLPQEILLPGSPLALRLPNANGLAPLAETAPPDRVKFASDGFADVRNRVMTLEGSVGGGSGAGSYRYFYYCYLSVANLGAMEPKDPVAFVERGLATKTPNTDMQAEDKIIEGQSAPWRRVRIKRSMSFPVETGGVANPTALEGVCEIWARPDQATNTYVMIVWRLPESIAQNVELDTMPARVAATLRVKQ